MTGLTEEDVAQHDLDLRFCLYGLRKFGPLGTAKTFYLDCHIGYPMGPTLRKDCMKIFIRTFGGVEALRYFTGEQK